MKRADDALVPSRRSTGGPLRSFGRYVDIGLQNFFGTIASFVVPRPWKTISACVLIAILLGAGIVRIDVITDSEKLYTPQGTQGFKDRDFVDANYGYQELEVVIYTTALKRNGSNILNQASLLSLLELWTKAQAVVGTLDGSNFTLGSSNVCYRPGGSGTPCEAVSILDFWGYSADAIRADTDLGATVSNTSALDQLGRTISRRQVMGGFSVNNSTGVIESVDAFRLSFKLQNNKGGSGSGKVDKVTEAWQKAVVPFVRNFNGAVDNWIDSPWAVDDAAGSAITGDVSLLLVGYVLLLVYGILVLSKGHPVESRGYMALLNVGSIALAVLAAYGLCCLVGVGFSLVVQLLALLLLGLGTDDMLITMAAHAETGVEMPNATVGERVVATITRARRGVVVAAMTNFVAFCTGASSSLPALRDFMIYAAVGIVLVMFFQSTFYVACLTLDVKRQKANKMDCLCCCTSSANSCCWRTYRPDIPDTSQRIIGEWLPAITLHPFGKAFVLITTFGLLAVGIVGALKITENFDDAWFIPNNSWIKTVYDVRDEYFPQYGGQGALPFGVYTKNPTTPPLDYFNYQSELLAISTNLANNAYVADAPAVQSWYVSYLAWLPTSTYSANMSSTGGPSSSAVFYSSLKTYLAGSGVRFKKDVIFSNTTANVIESSRFSAFFTSMSNSQMEVNAMHSVRDLASASAPHLNAVAFTPPFLFFEGFAAITGDTIQEIIIAGSVVFVIMLIMLADVVAAVAVGLMVVFIDVELVGFTYWMGLSFNAVTSINLLLAIGIAVDYSAFTAFSFMTRVGTRHERAGLALKHFGVAVFNGGFTLFLAILPAAKAQSFIFQTFFKMFSMIVALGLWHGLIALPVILSFIGSEPYDSAYEVADALAKQRAVQEAGAVHPREMEEYPMDPPREGQPMI
eukprot:TRINITY_DN26195_c0_g1_i1.p1 TRINITY_DN26195_c0_g1~~TRINITY_DN26195_c0_g1_i1.p1  ORF type:complete len:914 (+),score=150.79 TRINITY_DN26195_c0_g1_i1:253-2994(+)